MRDPRLEKLADVLVNYSVGVKPGHLVRISGPPVAQPLIIEVYRKVLAAGGHPAVRVNPDELGEILFKHGGDQQLKYVNPLAVAEYEQIEEAPLRAPLAPNRLRWAWAPSAFPRRRLPRCVRQRTLRRL